MKMIRLPSPSALRSGSWSLGALSVLVPGALLVHQLSEWRAWAGAQNAPVCGLPVLAMWILAMAVSAALSIGAAVLNALHLSRGPTPSGVRYAELALVAAPALVCVAGIVLFALSP